MMTSSALNDRIKAAGIAVVLQALLGWALTLGLRVDLPSVMADALTVFAVGPALPPPPVATTVRERRPNRSRTGLAAPPALKSTPTELIAPPPVILPPVPPPVVAAADTGTGAAPTIGNAAQPGVGTGTGGQGNGTGSGAGGDGEGGERWTPPRLIKGMRGSDYPGAAKAAKARGTVTIRYRVGTDGRVTQCRVIRGSGSAILDQATCPLAELRFRYRPALDEGGTPIVTTVTRENDWIIDDPGPRAR